MEDKLTNSKKDDVSASCNDFLKALGYVSLGFAWLKDVKSKTVNSQILTKISTQKKLIQQIIILIKLFQEQTIIINQPLLVVIVL